MVLILNDVFHDDLNGADLVASKCGIDGASVEIFGVLLLALLNLISIEKRVFKTEMVAEGVSKKV